MQSDFADLVFDLESGEALMIENLANLSAVEAEMSMTEVNKGNNSSEQEHPWIVSLALLLEGIVSQLIAIRLVVNLGILLKGLGKGITREAVTVALKNDKFLSKTYLRRGKSLWCL